MASQVQHSIYKRENDLKKADAVAYVVEDPKGPLVQYPFTFPKIGDDEVRAKITFTGLCASDHLHVRCQWAGNQTYPCCPGHEVIGVVTLVGSKVTQFKVGDAIGVSPQRDFCGSCYQCKQDKTNLCETKFTGLYDPYFGGYATHIQLPEKMTFHVPTGLPHDKIPPLMCAGITVYAPISRWAKNNPPSPDIKTAVIGIGGLGHLAIQYLSKLGYNVTAFSTNLNRASEYQKLGAHDTQHSTDVESLTKNAGKFSYIISTTFFNENDALKRHIALTRKNGTFTMVALPHKDVINSIDIGTFLFNQIRFEGSIIGSHKEIEEMLEFSNKNKVYPIVEQYTFEDFNKAFDKLENGRPLFRCVVDVQTWAKKNGFDK